MDIHSKRSRVRLRFVVASLVVSGIGSIHADTWNWDPPQSPNSSNWSDPDNWDPTPSSSPIPVNDGTADITFFSGGPATAVTSVVDVAWAVRSLSFVSNLGVNLQGAELTIGSGGITVQPSNLLATAPVMIGNDVKLSADETWTTGADFRFQASINTNGQALSIVAGSSNNNVLASTSLEGAITGSGSLEIKSPFLNSNVVQLSGANSYPGGTTIDSGATLQLLGGTLGAATGSLTVETNGTLDLNSDATHTGQTIGALNGSGGLIVNDNTSAFLATLTVGEGGADGSYAGSIADHTGNGTGLIALTKSGSGTQTLTGNNPYTGTTIVSAGTLKLANPGGVALSGTSNIEINKGGTLLMGSDNQINQATLPPIRMGGGVTSGSAKLDAGGFSQGTAGTPALPGSGTPGLGALTLNASSIVDMTGTSVLHFSNSSSSAWTGTLSVWDWTGTPTTGGGAEQLLFGTDATGLNATQLAQISFYSDNGMTQLSNTALILPDGEIIPGAMTPIPEPATWAGAALAAAAIGSQLKRRRRRSGFGIPYSSPDSHGK